ncbi:hypothetical protein GQ55_7G274000 [Panicum hallii var. hallii]|uniref:Uncharacterized protein n=1 Tax=Panicum hallii var. hallii TaxID=1504633 RepID=A0A2T7CZK2_9POAL|nr:hypothetical protein GQ55_7G274000 [Panicum hallii var. hallii]
MRMNKRLDLFALAVDSASPSVRAVVRVRSCWSSLQVLAACWEACVPPALWARSFLPSATVSSSSSVRRRWSSLPSPTSTLSLCCKISPHRPHASSESCRMPMSLVVSAGELLGDGGGALQSGRVAFAGFVLLMRVGVRFPLEDCNVIGSYVESCCKTSALVTYIVWFL